MKTVMIYASIHHGNTKKIVEAMAKELSADIIDITKNANPDISGYDIIGFASGIYFQSFHEKIKNFISKASFGKGQKVFLADTCGLEYCDYTKKIRKMLQSKGACCVGTFQCRGYDTFGIFGKIGGIAKRHPNEKDIQKARTFAADLHK